MKCWSEPRLQDILDLRDSGVWQDEDIANGISVLRSTNFRSDGTLDLSKLTFRAIPKTLRGQKLLLTGDILLERSGGSPNQPVGRVCYFIGDQREHVFGNFISRLRPKSQLCHSRYMFWYLYWFQSMGRTIPLIKKTTGIQNLDFKQYLNYRMPLPSPSEQRRIIEILDQADALRKQRNEADKIAEKILPALFNKMFGSVSSENIMTIQKLLDQDYLIVHKDGNFGSMYPRESDFGNEGVLFVTAKNVDELGFVDFQDSPRLNQEKADSLPFGWIDNGDVVLAHNATVGRVGIIENATERMLIGTSLTCFRTDPHKLDPYYLLGALRSNQFQNQLFAVMKQGTRNQVPITAQRRFSIANPRIEDQIKFGSQIRTLRSVFMNKQSVRVNIDRLFSTLLYQAFSGDLTAKWREAHMKELLQELEEQARELNLT